MGSDSSGHDVEADRAADPVLRLAVADLTQLVPGTNPRWWHRVGLPLLLDAGAVRRVGRRWLGRWSSIEAALTSAPPTDTRRGR